MGSLHFLTRIPERGNKFGSDAEPVSTFLSSTSAPPNHSRRIHRSHVLLLFLFMIVYPLVYSVSCVSGNSNSSSRWEDELEISIDVCFLEARLSTSRMLSN